MQTFLPLPSLSKSAQVLDFRRLGKQRVEAKGILNILVNGLKSQYSSHPAVLMWKGYEETLAAYYNCCIREWIKRGYRNNLVRWYIPPGTKLMYPPWFGGKIHSNHRRALLYKANRKWLCRDKSDEVIWYGQFDWDEQNYICLDHDEYVNDKPFQHYYWPVSK